MEKDQASSSVNGNVLPRKMNEENPYPSHSDPVDVPAVRKKRTDVTITFETNAHPPVFVAGSMTLPLWEPLEMSSVQNTSSPTSGTDPSKYARLFHVVEEGHYQYKFRLGSEGPWIVDESIEVVTDAEGNRNNLMVVSEEHQQQEKAKAYAAVPEPEASTQAGDGLGRNINPDTPRRNLKPQNESASVEPVEVSSRAASGPVKVSTPPAVVANTAAEVAESAAMVDLQGKGTPKKPQPPDDLARVTPENNLNHLQTQETGQHTQEAPMGENVEASTRAQIGVIRETNIEGEGANSASEKDASRNTEPQGLSKRLFSANSKPQGKVQESQLFRTGVLEDPDPVLRVKEMDVSTQGSELLIEDAEEVMVRLESKLQKAHQSVGPKDPPSTEKNEGRTEARNDHEYVDASSLSQLLSAAMPATLYFAS